MRLTIITILAALVTLGLPPRTSVSEELTKLDEGFDHSNFHKILRQTVRDQRVDYLAIRRDHRLLLKCYLDRLATFDPAPLQRQQKLALYINLYNATVIDAVIERYRDGYRVSEKDFAVFKKSLVRVAGQTMSLNDLEHKLIRPQFKDPRVHAALVCAAGSCPALLPRAYHARDLDEVLEMNVRCFIVDPCRNQVDHKKKQLRLSKIFQWYADDFGGKKAIAEYVNRYHPDEVGDYAVSFIEYSWDLNIVPQQQDASRTGNHE